MSCQMSCQCHAQMPYNSDLHSLLLKMSSDSTSKASNVETLKDEILALQHIISKNMIYTLHVICNIII